MIDDALADLDPEQRQVARELDNPVVVLAGAGSGKTRAVTHRIAHAVQTGRYAANATLAVTFTTRAAGEMKARLARLGAHGVQARTIHSAALRQAQYFWPRAYGVALPPVSSSVIPLVARVASGVLGRPNPALLRDLAGEISWSKASNVTPADYVEIADRLGRSVTGAAPEQVATVLVGYERAKLSEGVIDFDDILLCAAGLLSGHADIAREVRQAYRHFVVDEYQDISAIQHALIKLWVGERRDLCVVGDPNQAIHSFAGARPEFLVNFRADWPGATVLRLDRNYRSTPQVLDMANRIIGSRAMRLRPMLPAGPQPELSRFESDADEAAGIAAWLAARHAAGTPWQELAVLYRINAQSPPLESALTEAGVPYLVRGTERYYERAEIRQALTLIRADAAANPDAEALAGIRPALVKSGWEEAAPVSQGAQRERWESLNSLRDLVAGLTDDQPDLTLGEVAEELAQRAAWQQPPVGQAVTLATMHAAKGLEWSGVALAGVREGLVPFVLAESSEQLAEERRLLYVGITRAKTDLHISWATQGGRGRSRFLKPWADRVNDRVAPRPTRASLQARKCRVCDGLLTTGTDRKLGRHAGCPSSYDEDLFALLREWRRQTAEAESVPAFVIFTDATLIALAEALPTDRRELLRIPGIGTVKADRFGEHLLALVARHANSGG